VTKIVPGVGFPYNDTGSTQYVEPGLDGTAMLLGVSLAAASAGDKNLRANAYAQTDTYCVLAFNYQLALTALTKSSVTFSLHDGKAQLAGVARCKASVPRLAFQTGPANLPTFVNTGTAAVGNNANVVPTLPTRSVDDLLICVGVVTDVNGLGITLGIDATSVSNGWVQIGTAYNGGVFPTMAQKVWWKKAVNTAADAITVTTSGGGAGDTVMAQIYNFRYTHATTPVQDAKHEVAQSNATAINVPHPAYNSGSGSVANNNPTNVDQGGLLMIWASMGVSQTTAATPTVTSPETYTSSDEAAFTFTLRKGDDATTTGDDISLWMATASNPVSNSVPFQAFVNWNQTFTSTNNLRGALSLKPTSPVGYSVWLDGALRSKAGATLDLFRQESKNIAASIQAKSTVTFDLTRGEAKDIAASIQAKSTVTFDLNRAAGNDKYIAGVAYCRALAEIDYLYIGPKVYLSATLVGRASVAPMRLYTNIHLGVTAASKTTIKRAVFELDKRLLLQQMRGTANVYAALISKRDLGVVARDVAGATTSLAIDRRLGGAAAAKATTSLQLGYSVPLVAIAAGHAGLTGALGLSRRLAGTAFGTSYTYTLVQLNRLIAGAIRAQSAATCSLDRKPYLAAALRCKVTASMDLDIYRYEERFYPEVVVFRTPQQGTVIELPAGSQTMVTEPSDTATVEKH
jgi:hypothetical protein